MANYRLAELDFDPIKNNLKQFLTNYRESSKNYSRKRISFDLVYNIIAQILEEKE